MALAKGCDPAYSFLAWCYEHRSAGCGAGGVEPWYKYHPTALRPLTGPGMASIHSLCLRLFFELLSGITLLRGWACPSVRAKLLGAKASSCFASCAWPSSSNSQASGGARERTVPLSTALRPQLRILGTPVSHGCQAVPLSRATSPWCRRPELHRVTCLTRLCDLPGWRVGGCTGAAGRYGRW